MKNDKCTLQDLAYGEKTDKRGKWKTHMVGTGLWQENSKTWKMRHTQCRACYMARNSEKCEKGEMYTVRPGLWQDI